MNKQTGRVHVGWFDLESSISPIVFHYQRDGKLLKTFLDHLFFVTWTLSDNLVSTFCETNCRCPKKPLDDSGFGGHPNIKLGVPFWVYAQSASSVQSAHLGLISNWSYDV